MKWCFNSGADEIHSVYFGELRVTIRNYHWLLVPRGGYNCQGIVAERDRLIVGIFRVLRILRDASSLLKASIPLLFLWNYTPCRKMEIPGSLSHLSLGGESSNRNEALDLLHGFHWFDSCNALNHPGKTCLPACEKLRPRSPSQAN